MLGTFDKLQTNQRSLIVDINLPNQFFGTVFLWKVSLKILNSGIILKRLPTGIDLW